MESEIPLAIGIENPSSADMDPQSSTLNPESTARSPESKTVGNDLTGAEGGGGKGDGGDSITPNNLIPLVSSLG